MEKFNEYIKNKLMEECELSEMEISITSKKEALDYIFTYEGFIGYTNWILDIIEEVYGISFDDLR